MGRLQAQRNRFAAADRLEAGDRIAPFVLPDPDGKPINPSADYLAGRPLLLVFECAKEDDGGKAYAGELAALGDRADAVQAQSVLVLAITRRSRADNGALLRAQALPFTVLSDPEAKVYAACGLDPVTIGRATVTLVLDGNMRVVDLFDGGGASRGTEIAGALGRMTERNAEAALGNHPPVLVLPRVLTPEDCANLIRVWHRPVRMWESDGLTKQEFNSEKGDFKVRNKGYGRVVQLVVRDADLQNYLDTKLQRRVMSEIAKAFQTKVSRREDYRIAGYDSAERGILGPHRDNPDEETRHRRFTLSIALNAGTFEGGALRFGEYSNQGYLVPTGTAIVWSCSLLHEVLPVTSGQRFILGTHLFGN